MNNKISKNEKIAITVAIFMTALFIVAVSAAITFSSLLVDKETEFLEFKESAELNISRLEGDQDLSLNNIAGMHDSILSLENDCKQLEDEIKAVEAEREQLIKDFEDSDEQYKILNGKLRDLNSKLEEKQVEIEKLRENILKLENVYSININRQFEIISEIRLLLEEKAPLRKVKVEKVDEDGQLTEVIEEVYPKIAIYYEDITKGYTYSYNDEEVFYSASCLKAPLALSILEKASEEAENIRIAEESASLNTDEDGAPETLPAEQYNRVYDFDSVFTYIKEDSYQVGSGKIKNDPDGTEYTYLELMDYMLRYSDNVAFNEIKEKYGVKEFVNLAYRLGTTALKKDLVSMTALDGAKVMRAIYNFIIGDFEYSDFMYDAMSNGTAHSVLIPFTVGKPTVHKYGWDVDAYHDIAVVFDENPYILIFLSDMDTGTDEVNQYVRSIIKLINELHENFYAKK